MNTEGTQDQTPTNDDIANDPRSHRADNLLRMLTSFTNETGVSISMTVHAGGTVISGTPISRADYFKLMGEEIRNNAKGGEGAETIAEAYGKITDDLAERAKKEDEAEEKTEGEAIDKALATSYLHMKDALIGDSSGRWINDEPGFLWRGRLTAIDGWMLGSIAPGTS